MNNNINKPYVVEQESNKNEYYIKSTAESILNNESLSLSVIEKSINVNKVGIPIGVSEFQIHNFVLSKRESPNDYAKFLQAKHEIYLRVQTILDLFYQYKKLELEITLFEGKIEKIQIEENYPKIRDSNISLQKLENEKNKCVIVSIKNTINKKLRELKIFYKIYSKHKHFETDSIEEIKKAEEEYWKIKSTYYPELQQKYNLTPSGFIPYPHEQEFEKFILEKFILEKFILEKFILEKFIQRINSNTNILSKYDNNDSYIDFNDDNNNCK